MGVVLLFWFGGFLFFFFLMEGVQFCFGFLIYILLFFLLSCLWLLILLMLFSFSISLLHRLSSWNRLKWCLGDNLANLLCITHSGRIFPPVLNCGVFRWSWYLTGLSLRLNNDDAANVSMEKIVRSLISFRSSPLNLILGKKSHEEGILWCS